jgi:hypothetical protein
MSRCAEFRASLDKHKVACAKERTVALRKVVPPAAVGVPRSRIDEAVEAFKNGDGEMLRTLLQKVMDLKCPDCNASVPVEFQVSWPREL